MAGLIYKGSRQEKPGPRLSLLLLVRLLFQQKPGHDPLLPPPLPLCFPPLVTGRQHILPRPLRLLRESLHLKFSHRLSRLLSLGGSLPLPPTCSASRQKSRRGSASPSMVNQQRPCSFSLAKRSSGQRGKDSP